MTYEDLEKLISKIISDDTVKDKSKVIVSKIKEIEDLSSYYEIYFLPIYDADGECVNKKIILFIFMGILLISMKHI